MRRLLPVAAAALLWAAPAQAFTKQTGTRTMSDGTSIAYDVYEPSGSAPAGGRPGVMLLHGLGGSKDDMAPLAQILAAHGYAVLAYSARGEGTSTGNHIFWVFGQAGQPAVRGCAPAGLGGCLATGLWN